MAATKASTGILSVVLLLSACQATDSGNVFKKPLDFLSAPAEKIQALGEDGSTEKVAAEAPQQKTLASILKGSAASVNLGNGFTKSIAAAVQNDPKIIAARNEVRARDANLTLAQSQKDIQLNSSVYGGVEDISDKTRGVALVLSARRVVSDGGKIDASINFEKNRVNASQYALDNEINRLSLEYAENWIDLNRYEELNDRIESRLSVLNPLIAQLEKVALSGLGDVTQVSAAQRTVSGIRVTQTNVTDSLKNARLNFVAAFGDVPVDLKVDKSAISQSVPSKISDELVSASPAIQEQYANYLAAEANLKAVQSQNKFSVGLEARLSKPFGGSDFDSTESIGLVMRKDFKKKRKVEAELAVATLGIETAMSRLRALHRDQVKLIGQAQQTISTMEQAIALAEKNAEVTAEEIAYLRKQLIIGGSTLDGVLSAEARLYEAESQLINFKADKLKAEITILSSLGILSRLLNLSSAE